MATATIDEVGALEAIYCEDEEFKLQQLGDQNDVQTILTVTIRSDEARSHTVDITFVLNSAYPLCAPDIAISCPSLARTQTASLKTELDTYASTLVGEPMLLSLTVWAKEHLGNFTVDRTTERLTNRNDDTSTHRTVLLRLDHMRAKVRYMKTVCQWAEELGLTGRLICCERLIVILLQGTQDALKEYLVRHRTVAIDVDSKGRDCKERMMSILMDVPADSITQRMADFKVAQLGKATEVEELFVKSGLALEYRAHVLPLMKRH